MKAGRQTGDAEVRHKHTINGAHTAWEKMILQQMMLEILEVCMQNSLTTNLSINWFLINQLIC